MARKHTTTRLQDESEREARNNVLFRAWERLKYPAGDESRARLAAAHANRRHGW